MRGSSLTNQSNFFICQLLSIPASFYANVFPCWSTDAPIAVADGYARELGWLLALVGFIVSLLRCE